LGGRLDATNIVTPLVSVITNIQFDHQAWLGDTLAKIAAEKAGIIKARVPVVTAVDEREAFRVLFEVARQNEAPFWLITWTQSEFPPLRGLELPLLGEHQRLNAAVATYAVRAVGNRIAVSDDDIRAGLLAVRWPGRLQLIERAGGKKFLLDGALAKRILLAPVRSQRTAAANELAKMCREANASAEVIETNSLAEALTLAEPDEFVVIAGSLYLIGEAMEMFKLGPSKSSDERGLNEWGTRGN
jgi:dihydrofolate synthase/folylpolyglutamate synthase